MQVKLEAGKQDASDEGEYRSAVYNVNDGLLKGEVRCTCSGPDSDCLALSVSEKCGESNVVAQARPKSFQVV